MKYKEPTIEGIMNDLGVDNPFTKEGYFTPEAEEAYTRLYRIVYSLSYLGVIDCDGYDPQKRLSKIMEAENCWKQRKESKQ